MSIILVPVDGSGHAMKALHIACDLAEKYGGRIIILHVLMEGRQASDILKMRIAETFDPKLRAALQTAAETPPGNIPEELTWPVGEIILENAANRVQRRGLEAEIHDLVIGNPAENILLAQTQIGAGTIVMGSRGVSASSASSFGSVSNRVFARAECTCLSVK